MCVVSAIHDGFRPVFPPPNQWPYVPAAPPADAPTDLVEQIEKMRKVIDLYRRALEIAEEADELTDQPDCEDPEKGTLVERVNDLERRLDELEDKVG